MRVGRVVARLVWPAVTLAALLFAAWMVADTLRSVVPLWSPLPWFDEWATVRLLGAVQAGERSLADVLFSQHNEHRILVPRLVFFADDLLFGGRGRLSLCAIVLVQALHAALFGSLLASARPASPGRWAVACVVVAIMFSLRQAENFTTGFQLQFVGVFAGATLAFVLFGLAVSRARAGQPLAPALLASFAAVLATAFTMANGLAAAYVVVGLAAAARLRARLVLLCAACALLLTAVYLWGYQPVAHHSRPADSLRHPLAVLAYVAAYLGSLWTSGPVARAEAVGALGMVATVAVGWRILRDRRPPPAALALFGVMLFVGVAAAVTASGRLEFGVAQALSSRYATGSAAFWAAHLTYWWREPPLRPRRDTIAAHPQAAGAGRVGLAMLAGLLCFALAREQRAAKPQMAAQSFALAESTDLLLVGLHDPAVLGRSAWAADDVERLSRVLADDHLSIFATPEAAALGHSIAALGAPASPDPCGGDVSALADPALGTGGVRVSGLAFYGPQRRLLRRILIADDTGRVVGLASGAVPGAPRSTWRGVAVARGGARLTAYGLMPDGDVCRIGAAVVADGPAPARPDPG